MIRKTGIALTSMAFVILAGCATVGPNAIENGQFDYNQAIINTRNEQMLANLVRLRYRDPPFFLQVTSISAAYTYGGDVGVGAGVGSISSRSAGATERGSTRTNSVSADAGVVYQERPTITYSPLQGEEFVQQLMEPVKMKTILLLSISGWRLDRLLRCCVQRVNDLRNAPSASGPTPTVEPEFKPFLAMAKDLETLSKAGALDLRFEVEEFNEDGSKKEADKVRLFLLFKPGTPQQAVVNDVKAVLGIDPDLDEYELTPNPTDRKKSEIAIFPRSVLSVMNYLSQGVDPLQRDKDANRVVVTKLENDKTQDFDWSLMTKDLFTVHSSPEEPEDAFVKVRYRDAWFFIKDTDHSTKATFNLLEQLFQLKAATNPAGAPTPVIPVG